MEPWARDGAGELLVGGQPLSRVVAAIGATPCYLYDRARIARRAAGRDAGLVAGLGYGLGQRAVDVVLLVDRYASVVSLTMIAVTLLVPLVKRQLRRARPRADTRS